MKKAQIEIVGLLIIVMMVSFIMLFALKAYLKPGDDVVPTYKHENLASGIISAMLRTDSGCTSDTKVKQLLIDCAKWKQTGTTELVCGDGNNSCEYVNNTLELMLDKTFNNWSKTYELIITSPAGDTITHLTGGNLSIATSGEAATQPLPVGLNYGSMEIKLCVGGC